MAERVAAAKAELLNELEGWGDQVKAAAGAEAAERVKTGSEVGTRTHNAVQSLQA